MHVQKVQMCQQISQQRFSCAGNKIQASELVGFAFKSLTSELVGIVGTFQRFAVQAGKSLALETDCGTTESLCNQSRTRFDVLEVLEVCQGKLGGRQKETDVACVVRSSTKATSFTVGEPLNNRIFTEESFHPRFLGGCCWVYFGRNLWCETWNGGASRGSSSSFCPLAIVMLARAAWRRRPDHDVWYR